ncbi:hypothetical protein ACHAWX_006232 [Stephanocyclus meneghinianus]
MFNKCASSLICSAFFAAALSLPAFAEIHQDLVKFQSSILAQDCDFSLSPKRSNNPIRPSNREGHQILRSCIDRDPIDIDDEYHVQDESTDILDNMQHVFSSHHHQWKSPLERISSPHTKPPNLASAIVKSMPTTMIHEGPWHTHQIKSPMNQLPNMQNLQLKTRKTGTTIAALLACNSTIVILAADTRATDGTTVADSNCEKLHQVARNVWCAGAGTSGDVEAIVRSVKFLFWKRGMLNEVGNTGRQSATVPRINSNESEEDVPTASLPAILHCLRTQLQKTRGQLGVNLLVGGYDSPSQRATLAAIHPHGSMDVVTYAALGSGGLAATGVLESRYPKIGSGSCSLEEGIRLAVDAVTAGVKNDLGSGSRVDVCIIAKEGVLYRRAVVKEEVLEWMVGQEDLIDVTAEKSPRGSSGVNGFGNVPFAIQSEKVVVSGEVLVEKARRRWMDKIIGTHE